MLTYGCSSPQMGHCLLGYSIELYKVVRKMDMEGDNLNKRKRKKPQRAASTCSAFNNLRLVERPCTLNVNVKASSIETITMSWKSGHCISLRK